MVWTLSAASDPKPRLRQSGLATSSGDEVINMTNLLEWGGMFQHQQINVDAAHKSWLSGAGRCCLCLRKGAEIHIHFTFTGTFTCTGGSDNKACAVHNLLSDSCGDLLACRSFAAAVTVHAHDVYWQGVKRCAVTLFVALMCQRRRSTL